MIQALSLIASASVLVAYFNMQRGAPVKRFDRANALCAPPIMLSEVVVGAWGALVLTVAFGSMGALGWWRATR